SPAAGSLRLAWEGVEGSGAALPPQPRAAKRSGAQAVSLFTKIRIGFRSTGGPGHRASTEYVGEDGRYRLAGIGTAVHDESPPPLIDLQLLGGLSRREHHFAEQLRVARFRFVERIDVPLGNDQRMRWRDRLDVGEGQDVLVFEQHFGRN